jgi:ATP synthase protein I
LDRGYGSHLMDEDLKKTIRALGFLSTVGLSMVLAICLGAFIGYYLDKWLGTSPWLLLVFLGFGVAAAFRNLFITYKKAEKL